MTQNNTWPKMKQATGISYLRSSVTIAQISDGTSCTYMLGEKYLREDYYSTGQCPADNESMYCGYNNDNHRITGNDDPDQGHTIANVWAPMQDRVGYTNQHSWGSAHSGGLHMSFCDGSVKFINYTIDRSVQCRLANRKDGTVIDAKAF